MGSGWKKLVSQRKALALPIPVVGSEASGRWQDLGVALQRERSSGATSALLAYHTVVNWSINYYSITADSVSISGKK